MLCGGCKPSGCRALVGPMLPTAALRRGDPPPPRPSPLQPDQPETEGEKSAARLVDIDRTVSKGAAGCSRRLKAQPESLVCGGPIVRWQRRRQLLLGTYPAAVLLRVPGQYTGEVYSHASTLAPPAPQHLLPYSLSELRSHRMVLQRLCRSMKALPTSGPRGPGHRQKSRFSGVAEARNPRGAAGSGA